jgi:hypothetical protein
MLQMLAHTHIRPSLQIRFLQLIRPHTIKKHSYKQSLTPAACVQNAVPPADTGWLNTHSESVLQAAAVYGLSSRRAKALASPFADSALPHITAAAATATLLLDTVRRCCCSAPLLQESQRLADCLTHQLGLAAWEGRKPARQQQQQG